MSIKLKEGGTETYLITLPRLRIDGLVYGKPYVELVEHTYIQSSSNYHAAIEWKGKGWISGKPHSFKATVSNSPAKSASPLYVISGEWHESSKYAKGTKGSLAREGDLFLDVASASKNWKPVSVRPTGEQGPMESRVVWQDVADGIRRGDFDRATAAKTKLENEQRAMRKEEKETGKNWVNQYFDYVQHDEDYAALGGKFGITVRSFLLCLFRWADSLGFD